MATDETGAPREWAPIKIERNLARTLRMIAISKDMNLYEYIERLLKEGMQADYNAMIGEMGNRLPGSGRENAPTRKGRYSQDGSKSGKNGK